MDTSSPLPTAFGPAANSPSDLSYSSGASHTSTRNTSPDSVTNPTAVSSSSSSQLASQLLELSFNSDIERNPSSILLNPLTKMDRNPFQSVNERRNKISTDRTTNASQNQQLQQQQQQQHQNFQSQTLRSNMQSLNTAVPRSLVSSNWRSQTADETALLTRAAEFTPFDATNVGHHHMQHGSSSRHSSYTSPRLEQFPQQQQLSSLVPYSSSSITFSDLQIEGSYAYCYDRGNGQYTRLIPADMLPALKDIPALQSSCSGMVVLPVPRGLPSNGRSRNNSPVLLRSPPNTPTSTSDNIQSRIDNIVASTPPTPTSLTLATGVTGLGPGSSAGATGTPHSHQSHSHHSHSHSHHNHHHHHHNSSSISGQPQPQPHQQQQQQPQRRPKIYCDKWVHEGVCAFTQQGCKYKHEMPFDKVTQHQLGLFHGFPAWWKKHQADLSRQRDGTEDVVRLSGHGGHSGGGGGSGAGGGERFIGRGTGHAHGHGVAAGSAAGAGAAEGMGMTNTAATAAATTPTTTTTSSSGLQSWRRGADAGSPVEQKVLGEGLNLAREVRGGVKNPFVSYSSPFGPIAPPARTSSTTPAAAAAVAGFTTDLFGSGQSLHQNNTSVGASSPTSRTGMGMGMAGGNTANNSGGMSNTNPYSSLSSLDEEIISGSGSGSGKAKPEEQSEKSKSAASGASGAGSSGARLT
ncbi:uncharacterized protein F4812DRAFT_471195 [Daldinia caldariorum]|uniref:uncharacterized protein n=1 Tax=Daldinia caldariorum TaxID=326644 RepID=UPI00200762A7|nr:uncharacterized protein F4812DRAFT_471195 [Daldinia caldariorum]KAI1467826.1 hypothetical protein F4812DRAFT_471195 [Daldinia caldariorum]